MRSVLLSGFAGTGKTTVAPLVAKSLGLPWVDTDTELASRHGEPVPALWQAWGEGGFREREGALVRELLDDGVRRVVSLGGGAVTQRGVRHLALDRATLVTLRATAETILARTSGGEGRPLLQATDPLARVRSLLEDRAHAYAECHAEVDTDTLSAGELAKRVVAAAETEAPVVVALGTRSYRVAVVDDAPGAVSLALERLRPSSLVVVTDETVRAARGPSLEEAVRPLRVPVTQVTLEPGEENKTVRSVEAIWSAAVKGGADRSAVVVAFGGGVVGDLAGFAAATLLRGVRFVQAPTTLLAMADSSVGGKTGFDLAAGKNLVGAFHQPSAVVVDTAHLRTLPPREVACGLAEIAKVALAFDATMWSALERDAEALRRADPVALLPLLRQAIALKAAVVRDDELDVGARILLNLGHTVGHALEAAGGFSRHRHGEAVSLGMVAECEVAERLGLATEGLSARVAALLSRLDLPTESTPEERRAAWPLIAADKKRRGGSLDLPLPLSVGRCEVRRFTLDELARGLGLPASG